MSVSTATQATSTLDGVFHALADPTRRSMLAALATGPASVSELAEPFDVTLAAIVQHLAVLEESGLISSRKEGRVRTCRLESKSLRTAEEWIADRRDMWERRLDRLQALLEKP